MILEQLIKSGFRYFLKTRVRVGWWKFCVDLTERWHSERAGMYLKLKAILGRKKTLTLKVMQNEDSISFRLWLQETAIQGLSMKGGS